MNDSISSIHDGLVLKRAELGGRLQELDNVIAILERTSPHEPDARTATGRVSRAKPIKRPATPNSTRTIRDIMRPATVEHIQTHGQISGSELSRQYKMPRTGTVMSAWSRGFRKIGFKLRDVVYRVKNDDGKTSYGLTPYGTDVLDETSNDPKRIKTAKELPTTPVDPQE